MFPFRFVSILIPSIKYQRHIYGFTCQLKMPSMMLKKTVLELFFEFLLFDKQKSEKQ